MAIDSRLMDVDLAEEGRRLGYIPGDLGARGLRGECRFARYGEELAVIPESQWKDLASQIQSDGGGCSALVTRIYNQGNEGSCVANACSQAHEIVQAVQFGREFVAPLSAISLYKRIGRSPNSGAMVSDGLDEMAERGVLPLDTAANRTRFGGAVMPNTGFRTAYPGNWEATAAHFRAHEWYIVDSVAELISALLNQHPVVVGRSGHSICYCDAIYQGSSLVVKYANSWSDGWGEGGFGYDSLRMIRSSASWAFALRAVAVPSV